MIGVAPETIGTWMLQMKKPEVPTTAGFIRMQITHPAAHVGTSVLTPPVAVFCLMLTTSLMSPVTVTRD
jgi:hypothetical protein